MLLLIKFLKSKQIIEVNVLIEGMKIRVKRCCTHYCKYSSTQLELLKIH